MMESDNATIVSTTKKKGSLENSRSKFFARIIKSKNGWVETESLYLPTLSKKGMFAWIGLRIGVCLNSQGSITWMILPWILLDLCWVI